MLFSMRILNTSLLIAYNSKLAIFGMIYAMFLLNIVLYSMISLKMPIKILTKQIMKNLSLFFYGTKLSAHNKDLRY
jgi:hypothetical protein